MSLHGPHSSLNEAGKGNITDSLTRDINMEILGLTGALHIT